MPDKPLPKKLQKRFNVKTVNELWRLRLSEGNTFVRKRRHFFSRIPSGPRCVQCHRPFKGIGGALFRTSMGMKRSDKNPRFCNQCYGFTSQLPGGAEVDLTMLFVDVRGSTTLAEKMNNTEFSALMNRFYESAINVNVAARLASNAGPGEVLVSQAAAVAAAMETGGMEKRDLALKGKTRPVSVCVLRAD